MHADSAWVADNGHCKLALGAACRLPQQQAPLSGGRPQQAMLAASASLLHMYAQCKSWQEVDTV